MQNGHFCLLKGENCSSRNNNKKSKKDSSQRRRQTDGMYSIKWTGTIHVKHMSKDNDDNKKETKLKPGDPRQSYGCITVYPSM